MDYNKDLKAGRILALKVIAETYLLSKGNKKTKEIFPKDKFTKETELADGDVLVLHNYLMEKYHKLGLDLEKSIEATGEKVVPGKMSQYELKELLERADELIVMMGIFKNYQK